MRKLSVWMIAILLCASYVQAQTQTKAAQAQSKPAAPAGEKGEFKVLLDNFYAAWNSMDPAKADPFYAKDANLVFFDITPLEYKGWKAYKEGATSVFAGFKSMKLTPNKDVKVTKKGKVAWTTLTFHASVVDKAGKPMEMDGRHTAIWEKTQGKWLIVHEHVSVPLPSTP